MERLTVVMADPDQEYLEMLLRFVRSSEFAQTMTIKAFSNEEHLHMYLRNNSAPHIVLVEPKFLSGDDFWGTVGKVILLANSHFSKDNSERFVSVFKYQPVHQLLNQIKSLYLEQHEIVVEQASEAGKAKVLSFYSLVGGCGKTTVAINMARQLSLSGQKVLYISLESISSAPIWFGTQPNQEFSEILYYVQSNSKQVAAKIDQYKKKDTESDCYYIEPLTHIKEIEDVSSKDIHGLLEHIVSSCHYDYILLDCDSDFHDRTLAALACSHEIMLLLTDEVQCVYKTQAGISILQKEHADIYKSTKSNIHLIINKFTGQIVNSMEFSDHGIEGYLPYIPQWKNATQGQQLSSSQQFNHKTLALMSLFSEVN